jgi:hypothetical protein
MSSTYPPSGGSVVRPCTRCGKPLQPNEMRCSNCGYQNVMPVPNRQVPPSPSATRGTGAPPSYGAGQPMNPAWGQPPASLPAGPYAPQQSPGLIAPIMQAPGTPPTGMPTPAPGSGINNAYSGLPPTPKPPTPSAGGFYATPAQSARPPMPGPMSSGANFYGGSTPRQPAYPPVSAPSQASGSVSGGSGKVTSTPSLVMVRRNDEQEPPRIGVLITIVVVLVILIAGGGGGYLYWSIHHSNTATTTLKPTPTPDVPPLFSDNFTSNINAWDLQSVPGKYSVALANGSLKLEDDDNHLLWELLPGNRTFSDFHLSVNAELSKGDQNNGYGIYIRGASNQNTDLATYYRFEIYGDGTYAIFKGVVDAAGNSTATILVNYTYSSVIYPKGQMNHIEIAAKGTSMTLIVNGQTIKTITDDSYTSGTIALFVSNLQGAHAGAQATFSNFVIYPANA